MLCERFQRKRSETSAVPSLHAPYGSSASVIDRIADNVINELSRMREILGESANGHDFDRLARSASASLSHIAEGIKQGRSMPWMKVNHCPGNSPVAPVDRQVRLGVFPISGNPLHWVHLLCGLIAMETFTLDKVLYVIAGSDPRKPDLAPAEARHAMAKSLLGLFHPLLEYSPLALGGSRSGEENLFRILDMNPRQPIHAFYIAGSDHYHRYRPMTGNPDTIQKLEDGIAREGPGAAGRGHRVSAVFLERERVVEVIPAALEVLWVRGLPVQTSSTSIRMALSDRGQRRDLYTLPFSAYRTICGNRLYDAGTCAGSFPSAP